MKNLVGLYDISKEEIQTFITEAKQFSSPDRTTDDLKNQSIAMLFFENSTRTKTSFEISVKRLGGSSVSFTSATSSIQKGETLRDTIQNLDAMNINAFVIRHSDSGIPQIISTYTSKPIINAGDGFHEHPTQALLDIFTIEEHIGDIQNKNILIIGDILHSRVARSNIFGLRTLGANVSVFAPTTLLPVEIESFGVHVASNLEKAIVNSDAIIILRLQLERASGVFLPSVREYNRYFGVDSQLFQKASKTVYTLHPGPINRGIEISNQIADIKEDETKNKSLILRQTQNGIAIRMAVLKRLCSKKNS